MLFNLFMKFKVPGQPITIRLFERIKSPETYDVFDVGLEYENPDFNNDCLVVGGAFGSLKRTINHMNEDTSEDPHDTTPKGTMTKLGAIAASTVLATSALSTAPVTAPVALVAGAVGTLGVTSLID